MEQTPSIVAMYCRHTEDKPMPWPTPIPTPAADPAVSVRANVANAHNKAWSAAVDAIVQPILNAGGSLDDMVVLLEDVAAVLILSATRSDNDEAVLHRFSANLERKLRALRWE